MVFVATPSLVDVCLVISDEKLGNGEWRIQAGTVTEVVYKQYTE